MTPKWQVTRLLHGVRAIVGGQGPPLILIPGWPQTAEAFSDIFEPLSKHYQFFALDPPGLGDSLPPLNGYDTANVSKVMAEAIHDILKERSYHLVGHDVGGWIAYPWAAQFQSNQIAQYPGRVSAGFHAPASVSVASSDQHASLAILIQRAS